MIINEPVRGRIPPPWFNALPGIERIQALSNGQVARPPLFRLLGIKPGHVGPGTCTWTMPASEWLVVGGGIMEVSVLIETALMSAALSTQPAGFGVSALALGHYHMRPPRPQAGTVMARARVINASRFFMLVSGEVEDASGRGLLSATAQYRILPCEPAPPAPPETLPRVEEPPYSTPDPILRPLGASPTATPFWNLLGAELNTYTTHDEDGSVLLSFPASEWLTRFSPTVPAGLIAQVLNGIQSYGAPTLLDSEDTFAGVEQSVYFFRPLPADGRKVELKFRTSIGVVLAHEDAMDAQNTLHDADGGLIAWSRALGCRIPKALRQTKTRTQTKRVLASLVFSDIVGSTDHLARLGDAEWVKLKEQHHELLRAKIAEHDGVEVDTAGDGFFVRFDSPAVALEYARAIRHAVTKLGIELRIGIHTGECELQGNDVTGMAVHVAARLESAAEPGEIVVSEVVKTLVMGSSHAFEDRGERELKGVPGIWRVFALAD